MPESDFAAHSRGMRPVLFVSALVFGCGSSPAPAPVVPPPPPPPVAAPVAQNPPGTLKRSEVLAFLDAGFGRFLQRVEVEPNLDAGQFRGWNIVGLRPDTFWQGVDLRPGDTVVQVNGLPIEREMQAFEAFESLRTADELRVSYYRGAKPRNLAYRIVD